MIAHQNRRPLFHVGSAMNMDAIAEAKDLRRREECPIQLTSARPPDPHATQDPSAVSDEGLVVSV